ncbi:MAG: hypothetical protein QF718_05100 [Phycisphaerales bacterium]|jgi:4-diphosphocytidyl-2-C-methyl-D-erythritol kinase|nr:hypothetical protein [Phycisphaerales bacterium]
MSFTKVQIKAKAKVNLSLSVGDINEDGMHSISSIMSTVDFCDNLEVTKLNNDSLSRYAIFGADDAPRKLTIDWPITRDLTVRAHRMLEHIVGQALPIQLKLEKRIPIGGGLGGGSSNAAAMLKAVCKLYELDLDLIPVAKELGSDVPFLLNGGRSLVSGAGEQLEKVESICQHLVLMVPEYGCPTGEVFDAFDEIGRVSLNERRVREGDFFNDLFEAACSVSECLLEDYRKLTEITKTDIHLSGSGSTMFSICDNKEDAVNVSKLIEENTNNIVAIATCTEAPVMAMERK